MWKHCLYMVTIISILSIHNAHACSPPKSHYKHVGCTSHLGVFLASKDDGLPVALLDKTGNKTADLFTYQAVLANEFKSGLLPVQKNGKIGYINDKGKVVIDFEYEPIHQKMWARGVSDGRIIIRQNGALGVIDTSGKIIVAPDSTYTNISDFHQGKATITQTKQSYQINKDGERIHPVSHQYSSTKTTKQSQTPQPPKTTPNPPTPKAFLPHQQDGKWGFVDETGTPMIIYTFDEVKPYSEGLAAVRISDNWGFIDGAGNLVIDFRFNKDGFIPNTQVPPSEPLMFFRGKAWIGSLNSGAKLCINTQGINVDCT